MTRVFVSFAFLFLLCAGQQLAGLADGAVRLVFAEFVVMVCWGIYLLQVQSAASGRL